MSEVRVALVAEGPTDRVIIEAALRALLPGPFTLAVLQPEPTRPQIGSGWCGVLKWCREVAHRNVTSLETDPLLSGFDLFVIHIGADVSRFSYSNCGPDVECEAQELPTLPCSRPCPPPAATVDELRVRLYAWLGMATVGPKTVLCIPSMASDAWLAVAFLEDAHPLLQGIECNLNVESGLAHLPLANRVKKTHREYQAKQALITSNWAKVRLLCTQAERFSTEVDRACR